MALVDTGARRTCIGNPVVEALSLSPSREDVPLRTAGGVVGTGLYDLRVVILEDSGSWGPAVNLTAPHIPSIGDAYQAIIGRDVLSLGDLTLERSGSYLFTL
ncbi:MAG: aspartyl protease family protein [Defluviicoccus sp.]|nr:aspartyl protease family protein [Defluviicoccus sp.]